MTKTERLQALAGDGSLIYFGSELCDSEDGSYRDSSGRSLNSFTRVRVRGWWKSDYPHGQTYGATYAPKFLGANFNEACERTENV